jgi:hypothetical protein
MLGLIDDFRIYERQLTNQEKTELTKICGNNCKRCDDT